MSTALATLHALAGAALFVLGLYALLVRADLLRRIMAINVAGAGVFLVLVAVAYRGGEAPPDPVPHAMVLTGIVVAVCGTAVALVLAGRVAAAEEETSGGEGSAVAEDGEGR